MRHPVSDKLLFNTQEIFNAYLRVNNQPLFIALCPEYLNFDQCLEMDICPAHLMYHVPKDSVIRFAYRCLYHIADQYKTLQTMYFHELFMNIGKMLKYNQVIDTPLGIASSSNMLETMASDLETILSRAIRINSKKPLDRADYLLLEAIIGNSSLNDFNKINDIFREFYNA